MTKVQRAPGIPKEKSRTVSPVHGPATIHLPLQGYALPLRAAYDLKAAGIMPLPTAAAEPLLDPPSVRVGSQGLRVHDGCAAAKSVVTVFPSTTPPGQRRPSSVGRRS